MSGHEQFGEDLALHALNALEGENRVALEKHLATCADCRLELEQLRGDGALLALSTMGPEATAAFARAIARCGRYRSGVCSGVCKLTINSGQVALRGGMAGLGSDRRSSGVRRFPLEENSALKQSVASLGSQTAQTTRELEDLRRIVAPIISPEAPESDAGVSQDSAAAAGKGVLFAEQELLAVRCK